MPHKSTRREFLATTVATTAGLMVARQTRAADPHLHRKKALIGTPNHQTLKQLKAAGFDGIESSAWDISPDDASAQRRDAEQMEMRIHSVLRGWTNFNSPKSEQVAQDIASVETALQTAQAYGADDILLVPCRLLTQVAVPRPEDFDIEFDSRTGHVTRVVAGDNSKYADYMKAQNEAVDMSRKAIEQLIPVAEKRGVIIALENVWNNLWVKPKLFANFVKSFDTPWVQTYFDIGNHVKYAAPQQWIKALGKTIVKIHVKDFVVDRASPQGGKFVDIRDGDVDWPEVINALDAVGYDGWMTIEGSGGLSLDQKSKRLDMILAGE